MKLYLVRHATARDLAAGASMRDAERPLIDVGRKEAEVVAQVLRRSGISGDLFITSPLVRARQTAEIFAEVFHAKDKLRLADNLAPGTSMSNLYTELKGYLTEFRRADNVFLFGHQPDMTMIAQQLLWSGPEFDMPFKKCGVARIDVSDIPPTSPGTLKWFLTPKIAQSLACIAALFWLCCCTCYAAPSAADAKTEASYLSEIARLDEEAKAESNIQIAEVTAHSAIEMRRKLAALYHKNAQYDKIPGLYDEVIKRGEQLVHMGAMPEAELAADYKYIGDLHSFLGNAEVSKKYLTKSKAIIQGIANASAKGTSTARDFAGVEKLRQQAKTFSQQKDFAKAEMVIVQAQTLAHSIAEQLQSKMLAYEPGYSLDRWHAALLKEADVDKDYAEILYSRGAGNLGKIQTLYENILRLKDSGGITIGEREADIAYLVKLCEANQDQNKAILYNIHLLKSRRSTKSESDPAVLETMDKFAAYLRKINEPDKAKMLEARAKAVRNGDVKLPPLWFSL